MTSTTIIGGILAGIILTLGSILTGLQMTPDLSLGQAIVAATPRIATSTTVYNTGGTAVREVIFARNPQCKSRVITTFSTPITISFDSIIGAGNIGSTTISGTLGHLQGASTTVAYDAELYGCDTWHAFGLATTTITVTELQ